MVIKMQNTRPLSLLRRLRDVRALCTGLALTVGMFSQLLGQQPVITHFRLEQDQVSLAVEIPRGLGHLQVLQSDSLDAPFDELLSAGAVEGQAGQAVFTLPKPEGTTFLTVRGLMAATPPNAPLMGRPFFSFEPNRSFGEPLNEREKVFHTLNRLGYGPSPTSVAWVIEHGLDTYLAQQLGEIPAAHEEDYRLEQAMDTLFSTYRPGKDTYLIADGDRWDLKKGNEAPPYQWNQPGFDEVSQASGWLSVPSGFGYSSSGSERALLSTLLDDMERIEEGEEAQEGYLSFFVRHWFEVDDPAALGGLLLKMVYDDGFIAYLNGSEVARANMGTSLRPSYRAKASNAADDPDEALIDISEFKSLLVPGRNLLAIELHNTEYTSSDAILVPELLTRDYLPGLEHPRIKDIESLQQLIHARGIYDSRQLQAVMAEFWENHFTTDYDKLVSYLSDMEQEDGEQALSERQAREEAVQLEYREYAFFHEHALDRFGDLLLYSATSPSMLVYLDNVLNRVGEPNENYAREILELYSFGVDNRYTQQDIEALARCFTGWQIRKVRPDQVPDFPASAIAPPTLPSASYSEEVLLDLGPGWKYFKGLAEPVPWVNSISPRWTQQDFDDQSWLDGETGMGYGDGDDATLIDDMRGNYASLYLRKHFELPQGVDLRSLLLAVNYDDGFVAYINGREVARSSNMEGLGTPPPHDALATGNRESNRGDQFFNLSRYHQFFKPYPALNTLAIQVHNVNLSSSDLSIMPRIVRLIPSADSISLDDPNGEWTFRFNPEEHDTDSKILFEGTDWEIRIPAGREGLEGLRDALDAIEMMANHISTREFICVKLVNRFVGDDISLRSYQEGSAKPHLIHMVDRAIMAWENAEPQGHIGTVLAAIVDPDTEGNPFWSREVYRAKVKTPVEYINSLGRALDWQIQLEDLPEINDAMGMHFFTRDDPDGWSEYGFDWINTGAMLERLNFSTRLARHENNDHMDRWSVRRYLGSHGLTTAGDILEHFNDLLFDGKLPAHAKSLILEFAHTGQDGTRLPWDPTSSDYMERAGALIGLILSVPEMHYQ